MYVAYSAGHIEALEPDNRNVGKLVEILEKAQDRSCIGPYSITCHLAEEIDALQQHKAVKSAPTNPGRVCTEYPGYDPLECPQAMQQGGRAVDPA